MSDPMGIFLPLHWMETLCAGDVDALLDMYADDAVFVATFVDEPLQGKDALRGYFENLMSKPNLRGKVHSEIDQNLGNAYRAISGTYEFSWDGEEGVDARYTFVIHQPLGFDLSPSEEWSIYSHHSSEFPWPEPD